MKKIGYLFPGQGSQHVGMGKDAAARHPEAAEFFAKADECLGYSLSKICFEGPEEELKKTEYTQPALTVSSAATLQILNHAGIRPFATAGHSLGEYTALFAAGVFDFETGIKLVKTRGEAFAQAGSLRPGAMAAIIGIGIDKIREVCAAVSRNKIVVPANINDPIQIVISGDPEAVHEACEGLKAAGAKRAIPLPVSGAFHSPLVAPAAERMRVVLAEADFKRPDCVFVNNVDARRLEDPHEIKDSLVRQVTGTVRWVECIEHMIHQGVDTFVEVGSGRVLSGLVKRINKDMHVYTTESADAIDKTCAALA